MFRARSRATIAGSLYLLAALSLAPVARALLFPVSAHAESGVVEAVGVGHDSSEAITNLLKTTIARYFRDQPQFTRTILQTEILPNASSFVQSYKLNDGSKAGAVSLNANVDLDVIHGLLALTPSNLGEAAGAKALVVVHAPKLPDSLVASLKSKTPPDPFAPLADAGRERFSRRDFGEATLAAEEVQSLSAGEDFSSPELLRGLGARADARVVLGVSGRFEAFENENAHSKEERLVLSAVIVDVKTGTVLGRASANVMNPKSRRDQYLADLQRNLVEESKDLFQDVFVAAGRKLVKSETQDEFTVVRVLFPSNATLVSRFKTLLETVPGVRSVVELSVKRGKYDFAVRPAQKGDAFVKAVASLQAPDISVAAIDSLAGAAEPDPHPPAVSVKLEPKETAPAPAAEGGTNAVPNQRR